MPRLRLPTHTKVGIIGGGQLGKMISLAAAKLGYRTHVFAEHENEPALSVTNTSTIGSFHNQEKLYEFASAVDCALIEFENIPISAVDLVMKQSPLYPSREALYVAQNRIREKEHIKGLGIEIVDFLVLNSYEELQNAVSNFGYPSLLKTSEFGYDGRGQYLIMDEADTETASKLDWSQQYILERFVEIHEEISLIVAVSADKTYEFFPIAANKHVDGILRESVVPTKIAESICLQAKEITASIALSLNITGILTVEFFITNQGQLLVNEIAPRPHNSGHWSIDACNVSQFEQFIRAACGLPLRQVHLLVPCTTQNILGEEVSQNPMYTDPRNSIFIYGKHQPRANRKMGHINVLKY